jgi:hypothetical protein
MSEQNEFPGVLVPSNQLCRDQDADDTSGRAGGDWELRVVRAWYGGGPDETSLAQDRAAPGECLASSEQICQITQGTSFCSAFETHCLTNQSASFWYSSRAGTAERACAP